MSATIVPMPDTRGAELARQASTWPIKAQTLEIVDAETLQTAGEELVAVRALLDEAHARFDPICDANYNAWQIALRERKTVVEPLETAEKTYKRSIVAWDEKERARVREEQREREQAALDAAIEEREAVIEHAETLGATPAEVQSIIDRPLQPAPTVAPVPVRVAPSLGISKPRENWKGEITDKRVLVEFIAKNGRWDLLSLLTTDGPACNRMAGAIKATVEIPGVRFWNEANIAVRRPPK